MSDFGSYDAGSDRSLDKYKRPGEEEEGSEADTGDRDQLVEESTAAFEGTSGKLNSGTQETFQTILETCETYFDSDRALAAETLRAATGILEQFAGLSDEEEIEVLESELADDILTLSKMATRLEKKGTVH